MCLFVLGGSYFYLGRFDEAQPFIDNILPNTLRASWPCTQGIIKPPIKRVCRYWDEASELLDKFLADYPDPAKNIYTLKCAL